SPPSAVGAGCRCGMSARHCGRPACERRGNSCPPFVLPRPRSHGRIRWDTSLPRLRGRVRVGAGMTLLAIRDLSKRFGGVNALAGVSFGVDEGDVLGIIGPNGAGKTTLLNCISGLYRPDAGDIRWGAASISGMAPYRIARLGIGRTFQIVRPFPSMTVRENTAMGALFGQPDRRLQ